MQAVSVSVLAGLLQELTMFVYSKDSEQDPMYFRLQSKWEKYMKFCSEIVN